GCKRVAYLESTGTQYIDTGITVNANTKLSLDFQMTDIASGTNGIFGASTGQILQFLTQKSRTEFVFQWTPNSIVYIGTKDTDRHIVTLDIPNEVFSVDTNSTSLSGFTFSYPTGNMKLMSNGHTSVYGIMKIYKCQIYDGDTLLRDFIPVLDWDMKPAMYDKVSQKLYYNAGSGVFKTD
ncbi:MAG: hypothetical protein ACI4OR_01540, partial [Alphaproteobacteria bacterium]